MRLVLFVVLLVCVTSLSVSAQTLAGQPVPFSHKQYAEQAHLKCHDCHKLAASGEVVSIPTGKSCMACHTQIGQDRASIKDLKTYVDENQPVPWVRVYEIPGFVDFSHKVHVQAGADCSSCHGPVATRDRLWRETDLSMGGCLNCHRAKGANVGCNTCHDLSN